jgi:hypothetical protein
VGQRANFVIVRNGDWRLYYDHWCANRLEVELFWGPRLAAAFIEQLEPLAGRDDWLDDVWCEGGAVLDLDRRALTWFGGEDIGFDVPLRRACLALMKRQWPGWEIRWAAGAVVDLGACVGIPAGKLIDPDKSTYGEEFELLTDYPEGNETLLTVRSQGRSSAARVFGHEKALTLGEPQLAVLLEFPRQPSLVWTGGMPVSGVHVDVDEKTLHYWRAEPGPSIEEEIRRAWPGWQVRFFWDRFEEHLRVASMDVQLPLRDTADLQREVLGHLRRRCSHAASNPVRGLIQRLGAKDAKINPWTEAARGSAGDEAVKLARLDELEARVPVL